MAGNKTKLKSDIKQLMADIVSQTDIDTPPADTQELFAEKLSTAIDNYIQTLTVNTTVAAAIPVQVVVSSGTGATTSTGTGTGNLS